MFIIYFVSKLRAVIFISDWFIFLTSLLNYNFGGPVILCSTPGETLVSLLSSENDTLYGDIDIQTLRLL